MTLHLPTPRHPRPQLKRLVALMAAIAALACIPPTATADSIVTMNPDGSNASPLLTASLLMSPAYSGAGSKIYFYSSTGTGGAGIYSINLDGTGRTLINAGGSYPAPSPDGTKIAFVRVGPVDEDIYTMNPDGTGVTRIADSGAQDLWPAYSSTGKIAFTSVRYATSNTGEDLYVVNANGTGLTRVTNDNVQSRKNRQPAFSPNGSKIAFTRVTRPPDPAGYTEDVYTMNADGTGITRLSTAGSYQPSYSRDGTKIAFASYRAPGGDGDIYTMSTDGSNVKQLTDNQIAEAYPSFAPNGTRIAFHMSAPSYPTLLQQYAPELRYDTFENYRADSAETITDNYVAGQYSNQLTRGSTTLAVSDPTSPFADLKLGYLNFPLYSDQSTALSTDNLDEANHYPEDAQRLHGDPRYADRLYGRVKNNSDGRTVLQYWFFYYYNSHASFGVGVHEGDWEMAQVELNTTGVPTAAAFAQHGGGERCDWTHVQRNGAGRPIVYVGEGSHASYFSAGPHGGDVVDGLGGTKVPQLVNITTTPTWGKWPGRWGGSTGSGNGTPSPTGPGQGQNKAKFDDPLTWSQALSCTETQTQASAAKLRSHRRLARPRQRPKSAPPAPRIVARRRGSHVVIRYRFRTWPRSLRRRPRRLVTSVDPAGKRYPPLTMRSTIRHRRGRIVRPLGLGRSPFRLRIRAETKRGIASRTVAVPLL